MSDTEGGLGQALTEAILARKIGEAVIREAALEARVQLLEHELAQHQEPSPSAARPRSRPRKASS